jgi:glucokinase
LKISHFVFLNDFIAVSFGLLLLPEDNFISLNGLKINPKNTRGVLGPGTGLGNSIIYSSPFRKR